MVRLTKSQLRFMRLLASNPEPNIFAWRSRKGARIVNAFGPPENWTVFQIQTVTRFGTKKSVRSASLNIDEHFALIHLGYTKDCRITPAGRQALEAHHEQ